MPRRSVSLEPEELAAASPRRSTRLARTLRCDSPMIPTNKLEIIEEKKPTPLKRTRRSMSQQENYESDLKEKEAKPASSRRSTRSQSKDITVEEKIGLATPIDGEVTEDVPQETDRRRRTTRSVSKSPTALKPTGPTTPTTAKKQAAKRRLSTIDKTQEETKQQSLEVISENEEVNSKTDCIPLEKNNNKKMDIVESSQESNQASSKSSILDQTNAVKESNKKERTVAPEKKIKSKTKKSNEKENASINDTPEKEITNSMEVQESNDKEKPIQIHTPEKKEGSNESQEKKSEEKTVVVNTPQKGIISSKETQESNEKIKEFTGDTPNKKIISSKDTLQTNEKDKTETSVTPETDITNSANAESIIVVEKSTNNKKEIVDSVDDIVDMDTKNSGEANDHESTKVEQTNITEDSDCEKLILDISTDDDESIEINNTVNKSVSEIKIIESEKNVPSKENDLSDTTENKDFDKQTEQTIVNTVNIIKTLLKTSENEIEVANITKDDLTPKEINKTISEEEITINKTEVESDEADKSMFQTEVVDFTLNENDTHIDKEVIEMSDDIVAEKLEINLTKNSKIELPNSENEKNIIDLDSDNISEKHEDNHNENLSDLRKENSSKRVTDGILEITDSDEIEEMVEETKNQEINKKSENELENTMNKSQILEIQETISVSVKEINKNIQTQEKEECIGQITFCETISTKQHKNSTIDNSESKNETSIVQEIDNLLLTYERKVSTNVQLKSPKQISDNESTATTNTPNCTTDEKSKIVNEKIVSIDKKIESIDNITLHDENTESINEKFNTTMEKPEPNIVKPISPHKSTKSKKTVDTSISTIENDTSSIVRVSVDAKINLEQNDDEDNCESNISIVGSGSPDPMDQCNTPQKPLTIDIDDLEREHNLSLVNDDGKSYSPIGKAADIGFQLIIDSESNTENTTIFTETQPMKKINSKDSAEDKSNITSSTKAKDVSLTEDNFYFIKNSKKSTNENSDNKETSKMSIQKESITMMNRLKNLVSSESEESELDQERKRKRLSKNHKELVAEREVDESPLLKKKKLGKKTELLQFSDQDDGEEESVSEKNFRRFSNDEDSSEEDEDAEDINNEFIDNEAMEVSDEDTPSEDSNAIIDEGESIGSTSSEYDSDEDEQSLDSFVVDDDEVEDDLLSGTEDFLEMKKPSTCWTEKKRKRIIQISSDEEVDNLSMQPFGGFSPSHSSVNQVSSVDSDNESLQKRNEDLSKMIEDNIKIKDDTQKRSTTSDDAIEIVIEDENEESSKSEKDFKTTTTNKLAPKRKSLSTEIVTEGSSETNTNKDSKINEEIRKSVGTDEIVLKLLEDKTNTENLAKSLNVETETKDILKDFCDITSTEASFDGSSKLLNVSKSEQKRAAKRKSNEMEPNICVGLSELSDDKLNKSPKTPKGSKAKRRKSNQINSQENEIVFECKETEKERNLNESIISQEIEDIDSNIKDIINDTIDTREHNENKKSSKNQKKSRSASTESIRQDNNEIPISPQSSPEGKSIKKHKSKSTEILSNTNEEETEETVFTTGDENSSIISPNEQNLSKSQKKKLKKIRRESLKNINIEKNLNDSQSSILNDTQSSNLNETNSKKKKQRKRKSKAAENEDISPENLIQEYNLADSEENMLNDLNEITYEKDKMDSENKLKKKKSKSKEEINLNESQSSILNYIQSPNLNETSSKKKKQKKRKSRTDKNEDMTPEKLFEEYNSTEPEENILSDVNETTYEENKIERENKLKKKSRRSKSKSNKYEMNIESESPIKTVVELNINESDTIEHKYVLSPLALKKINLSESHKIIRSPLISKETDKNEKIVKKKKSNKNLISEDFVSESEIFVPEIDNSEKHSKRKKKQKKLSAEIDGDKLDDSPTANLENESPKDDKNKDKKPVITTTKRKIEDNLVKRLEKENSEQVQHDVYKKRKHSKTKENVTKTDIPSHKSNISYLSDSVLNFVVEKEKNVKPTRSEILTDDNPVKPIFKRGFIKPSGSGSTNCSKTKVEELSVPNLGSLSRNIKKKGKKQKYSNLNIKLISASLSGQTNCTNFKEEFLYGNNIKRIDSSQLLKMKRKHY